MVFLSPVSNHHWSGFIWKRSAHCLRRFTESLSGSMLNERKRIKSGDRFPTLCELVIDSCSLFILLVSVGQMVGQCVKKKSATITFPVESFFCISRNETC